MNKKAKKRVETTLPELSDLLEVIAGIEKRLRRLEQHEKRPIGFHTDCQSFLEVPDPPDDDENEAQRGDLLGGGCFETNVTGKSTNPSLSI